MREESTNTFGTAVTFLMIGLGIGAVVGLLYAPKPGKQLRKDLHRRYQDAREVLDDWTDDARDAAEHVIERGSDLADEIRDRVSPLTKAMRR